MPKNWAEKIFQAAMDSNTPFCDAICLISLCGCRPQEIGYGVSLSLCDDGKIEFSINGAKTNGGLYGQEWRSFSVSSGSAEFVYLVNRLKINNGKMVVQAKPGAICDKVTYLSRKCMPQLKSPVTAYCYRHRFSGILHGLGLDSELISMSLGHCTDVSKAYYSSSSRTGDSGFTISNIKSEKKVKMKNNLKKPWHPSWQAETNPMR